MDKEFIMATAKTAEQQILWSINKWEYMSWGIRQKSALEYEGMATLALRVSGAVHKGWVFISLNEGKDCYEVRLLNVARTKVKRTLDEVYCDNLGQVLDGLIERKAEWTDAQYKDKAVRDSARKMGMEVIDVSKKPEPQPQDKKFEHTDKHGLKFVVELYTMGDVITLRVLSPDDTLLWHNEMTKDTWDEAKEVFERTKARILDENDEIHNRFKLNNNSEDKAMKLNLSNNETKNAAKQQVNNANEPIVKQVDVMGLMGALSRDGHAKLSDHVIEDAEAVEVKDEQAEEIESVNVGEVTLATIMPKMTAEPDPTKQEVAEAIVKAATTGEATTKPMGKHGTLVIASGGGDKPKPKKPSKTTEPDPEAVGELAGMLTKVTLVTYTTKRGETAPRIIGFSGEDDPRWKPIHDEKQALIAAYNKAKKKDPKAKMTSSPFGPAWLSDREGNGEKTYCMTFGVKYMDVAKALCEAYNTTDRDQWAKAEQAVRDQKAGIAAGYQAEREARKAARQQVQGSKVQGSSEPAEQPAAPAMSNEEQAMFELFKKFMQGDKAAMAQVNEVLKAA